MISEKQLRQALGLQKIQKKEKAGRRLGQILVDEGYLDGKVLETFIQDQINDTLFDLFRWEEGDSASSRTRPATTRISASRSR